MILQITIRPYDHQQIELLAALFSSVLSGGLQIKETELIVYATEEEMREPFILSSLSDWEQQFKFSKTIEELAEINWNKQWERNFDPVVIEDILTIKANFHQITPTSRYTVEIQPKMSFGTGHHATTWMMVKAMSLLNLQKTKVLDAGTGTGILAILADMWKAKMVIGFDNDEWSYENAIENATNNTKTGHTEFRNGSLSNITETAFDIVLANINRNFLLDEADELAGKVRQGGYLVISGFYDVDTKGLLNRFEALDLVAQYLLVRESWACIVLRLKNLAE